MSLTVDPLVNPGGAAFDLANFDQARGRVAVSALPVIDLSPFTAHGDLAAKRRVATELRRACLDIGFFYLVGHGFTEAELEAVLEDGRRFFALPFARKETLLARNNSASLGFIQVGGLRPEQVKGAPPDLKERFYSSRDLAPGEVLDDASPAGWSQWPDEAMLPGFALAIRAATERKVRLALALLDALSMSLDLPEHHLRAFHERMGCIHSFNHYPPTTEDGAKVWGFSPHTDYGTMTILQQDASGGLQACNAAGEWIDVPPRPGALVVNVGDLLARWTNDVYVSSLHRVLNRGTAARISASFFVYANPRAEIACLETCQGPERPVRHEPVIAGQYIKELLTQAYETGRAGYAARTAERLAGTR